MAPQAICLGHHRCGATMSHAIPPAQECTLSDTVHNHEGLFYPGLEKKLCANSWNKPLHFDLYLFDKFLGLVGTGLEVRLNLKGTVKW